MKCLRCGHCCLTMLIIVVKDPEKVTTTRPVEDNLLALDGTKKCPHLQGAGPGQYSCAIHEYPWFEETPCGQFTQVERTNSPCRLGTYKLGLAR